MSIAKERSLARIKRKIRVRQKVRGTVERPRLCVFRSAKHIYAQIIEDTNGTTLVSAGTVNDGIVEAGTSSGNIESAKAVGRAIAKMALEKNIKQVVFDRNGFLYHGRVKALAEAARETGLSF
ncbi:MAG: 50S ribosomal protein L18 [Desulfuromonadales bacterium]|uniref:50S ribosomal protein L18 n=1 Tax=Desulfuromonas sp. KJ2020 TaxID=2919173 RepID=UPI000323428D|nr:50S ribosomal protein L18 [Desulfuromonas sp. KJ2020]